MAGRGDKRSSGHSGSGMDPNGWMTTFSDLVMLLLTFFVLLLTMKSMDTKAYKKIFEHISQTSGPLFHSDINIQIGSVRNEPYLGKALMIRTSEQLEEKIELMASLEQCPIRQKQLTDLKHLIDITENDEAVVIGMVADHLFESGDAQIRPDKLDLLDNIGCLLRCASNDIVIMGHTDAVPIKNNAFQSNWELSLYRALSILYYFSDHVGIRADRLAAGGFGASRPQASNDSEENRMRNRRVEFMLKKR